MTQICWVKHFFKLIINTFGPLTYNKSEQKINQPKEIHKILLRAERHDVLVEHANQAFKK